jgi:hypothetical protein
VSGVHFFYCVQLGIKRDAHYSIYEFMDGQFLLIDDKYQIAKLLLKWPQDSPFEGACACKG